MRKGAMGRRGVSWRRDDSARWCGAREWKGKGESLEWAKSKLMQSGAGKAKNWYDLTRSHIPGFEWQKGDAQWPALGIEIEWI